MCNSQGLLHGVMSPCVCFNQLCVGLFPCVHLVPEECQFNWEEEASDYFLGSWSESIALVYTPLHACMCVEGTCVGGTCVCVWAKCVCWWVGRRICAYISCYHGKRGISLWVIRYIPQFELAVRHLGLNHYCSLSHLGINYCCSLSHLTHTG